MLLEMAFSVTLTDAQNACATLGGVEFAEICEDLQKYAKGIEDTLETCAHKLLKNFSEEHTLERCGTNRAQYGRRAIVLKGGDSQFEAMKSAEIFLKTVSSTVHKIKSATIESKKDLREWLGSEFSGKTFGGKIASYRKGHLR